MVDSCNTLSPNKKRLLRTNCLMLLFKLISESDWLWILFTLFLQSNASVEGAGCSRGPAAAPLPRPAAWGGGVPDGAQIQERPGAEAENPAAGALCATTTGRPLPHRGLPWGDIWGKNDEIMNYSTEHTTTFYNARVFVSRRLPRKLHDVQTLPLFMFIWAESHDYLSYCGITYFSGITVQRYWKMSILKIKARCSNVFQYIQFIKIL